MFVSSSHYGLDMVYVRCLTGRVHGLSFNFALGPAEELASLREGYYADIRKKGTEYKKVSRNLFGLGTQKR